MPGVLGIARGLKVMMPPTFCGPKRTALPELPELSLICTPGIRRITSPMLVAPEFWMASFCTTVRAPAKFLVLADMVVPSKLLLTWIASSTGPALSALLPGAAVLSAAAAMVSVLMLLLLASSAWATYGMARQASAMASAAGRSVRGVV